MGWCHGYVLSQYNTFSYVRKIFSFLECGVLVRVRNPIKLGGEISVETGCEWRFVEIVRYTFWSSSRDAECWSVFGDIGSRANSSIGILHTCPLLVRISFVNQVSLSSLWYFIVVWVGSKKALGKIKALFCNYLWFGFENMVRGCVSRNDCTMLKKVGGPSLTSLEGAMQALMSKWTVQALLSSWSNLQTLLRYRIT